MATPEQDRILRQMTEGIQDLIEQYRERIPEHWKGIELRQWLADLVQEQFAYLPMYGAHRTEYKRDRLNSGI